MPFSSRTICSSRYSHADLSLKRSGVWLEGHLGLRRTGVKLLAWGPMPQSAR